MSNIEEKLAEIRDLLANDCLEEAEQLLSQIDSISLTDPETHLELAQLCEEAGMINLLVRELNLALRDAPDNTLILKRLAEVYVDSGQIEKATRCWKQVIKIEPDDPVAYEELGNLLVEQKNYEEARQIYQQGLNITQNPVFKNLLKSIPIQPSATDEMIYGEKEGELLPYPSDEQLVRFTGLFSGREGVYARQWLSPTGETGYTPIHEPFTFSVAKNHILGNYTVGIYQLRMDNTVTFIAFDIDIPKYLLPRIIADHFLWEKHMKKLQRLASQLMDIAAAHNLPLYIEDTGFKGRHCWIFLESPLPAKVARRLAFSLRNRLGELPPEVQLEVFPKQTMVKAGGLGSLIKLPLGIHRRSGKRALFITPEGEPYPNQLSFLEEIHKATKREIYAYLQADFAQPLGAPISSSSSKASLPDGTRAISPTVEQTATEPSPKPEPVPEFILEKDEEFQYLMLKCPVIKALIEKIDQYHELSSDERIVIAYSLGHLQNGPLIVNSLFMRCVDIDESMLLKSRLRGNPISCPKIRSRIPEITSQVDCNCQFEPKLNMYPNPLLHMHSLRSGTEEAYGQGIDSLQFQNLVQEFIKIRRQVRELELLQEKYQKKLDHFFEQTGINSIQTSFGSLKRSVAQDGSVNYILEL
jgi:tetratricopeptide (TPR) repeat protein